MGNPQDKDYSEPFPEYKGPDLVPNDFFKETNDQDPQYFIDRGNDLLTNYVDEIPTEHVNSITKRPDGKSYKVRKGWFDHITLLIYGAEAAGILTGDLAKRAENFTLDYGNEIFSKRLTTKKDIDDGNQILNEIIAAANAKAGNTSGKKTA